MTDGDFSDYDKKICYLFACLVHSGQFKEKFAMLPFIYPDAPEGFFLLEHTIHSCAKTLSVSTLYLWLQIFTKLYLQVNSLHSFTLLLSRITHSEHKKTNLLHARIRKPDDRRLLRTNLHSLLPCLYPQAQELHLSQSK